MLGPILALALAAGCATAPPPPPPVPVEPGVVVAAADQPFLVPPATGWPLPLDEDTARRLERAHHELLRGAIGAARQVARDLLAERPGLGPARVLAAQADLVDGDPAGAAAALEPLAVEHPLYAAAQLGLGRAAERLDDPVRAYGAFRAVAATNPVAARRVAELEPRVLEILGRRVESALARGETAAAEEVLARLRRWAPASEATVRAALGVAAARGEREAELAALYELTTRHGVEERDLLARRAELELAVGDPGAGVDLYEELTRRFPDDHQLAEGLAAAKMRWRVAQLPAVVGEAAAAAELERGDFAVLLYWLVPSVRHGRGGTARIASDILDDPRREEIARVVNLGLMDVDATLHRFYPATPVRRSRALEILAGLLRGGGAPCATAAAGAEGAGSACGTALACGLVRDAAECTAGPGLGGAEAVELLRRAVDRLPSP